MNDDPTTASTAPAATGASRRQWTGRLWRLVLKELRETLRDRRTIITLVVMPTLIYPLLALAFQRFLLTSVPMTEDVRYDIGVDSELAGKMLARQLGEGSLELEAERRADEGQSARNKKDSHDDKFAVVGAEAPAPDLNFLLVPAEDMSRGVADSTIHLGIIARRAPDDEDEHGLGKPMTWELVYRAGSPTSEAALLFVESRLIAFNARQLDQQLKDLGIRIAMPAATTRNAVEYSGAPVFSLAALIPLILVLMTVTGAVYPAIDLTAGERERGTLETLIAAPVPRLGLLLAKYAAVLTVALLTAMVNLTAMTITAHSTGLAATLFGEGGMSAGVVVKVLLLLALYAAFFSAILLALTSYARSFKEAQAYIIPLMLLCLVPGVLCLMPGLEFTGWMAVTPLVNIVMLARDLLEGQVDGGLAAAAVCSTIFYIAAAIALAARIFGTDAILYGSQSTWSDIFHRPADAQPAASLPAAMFCLALMFPSYFVLANGLVRSPDISVGQRLAAVALITAVVFAGIPVAIATFGRVRFTSGLGLKSAGSVELVAAALLGLALWPVAHELFLAGVDIGVAAFGEEQVTKAKRLLDELQSVPAGVVLVTLALVPGVIEELCFRGFLFSSLRTAMSAWQTVVVSAVLFGLFHEVLGPGRFLPSAFLGLVLGWVRLRTRSVLPCMVLHTVHNSLLWSIILWRDELAARGCGVEERAHLPETWLVAAAVGIVLAVAMLLLETRGKQVDRRSNEDEPLTV
jgi:ABC-2 type transport system permease protein/sodium transport system permease protein